MYGFLTIVRNPDQLEPKLLLFFQLDSLPPAIMTSWPDTLLDARDTKVKTLSSLFSSSLLPSFLAHPSEHFFVH
jgi:hypothetical protein